MKYKYTVIVDEGQCTGARFNFLERDEVIDFIDLCFDTEIERDLQISMKIIEEDCEDARTEK